MCLFSQEIVFFLAKYDDFAVSKTPRGWRSRVQTTHDGDDDEQTYWISGNGGWSLAWMDDNRVTF